MQRGDYQSNGRTSVILHVRAGVESVRRGEAIDPDYGDKNCTEYPASVAQRCYEEGRLGEITQRKLVQRNAARLQARRSEPGSLSITKGVRIFPSRNGSCVGKARMQFEPASVRR